MRPEPEDTTRGHHEQPGAAFGLIDDEVVHLADTVTVRVEHHEPSDVVARRGRG